MYTTFDAVRAEALFASTLQPSDRPAVPEVRLAVAATLRQLRIQGCAAYLAGEFGDHPDAAATRMRWALATVRGAYPPHPLDDGRLAGRVRAPGRRRRDRADLSGSAVPSGVPSRSTFECGAASE
jgi:hypothetical protein